MIDLTPTEIQKLPTILEILDNISKEEEGLRNDLHYKTIITEEYEGKFELVKVPETNEYVIEGKRTIFDTYYRGQTTYYAPCTPAFYRPDNRSEVLRIVSKIRVIEFELLLKDHPVVKELEDEGIKIEQSANNDYKRIKVDYAGLAQHYGFRTELMDLTSSKWTAAFFASCYNKNGKYQPVTSHEDYGVFYSYTPQKNGSNETSSNRLSVIGLQPFKRPGEQRAYSLKMSEGEDFNLMTGVKKYLFRHDRLAAQIIFNRLNQGSELFPLDPIIGYADHISRIKQFSREAFEMFCAQEYLTELQIIQVSDLLESNHFKIRNHRPIRFERQTIKKFRTYWENEGRKKFLRHLK
jgi:hypothetical protein